MPTPFEAQPDERSNLAFFLDVQREAILRKLDGLTEEQARSHPTASELCLLTLVKHVAYVERRWMWNGVARRDIPGLWPPADPEEELRIDPGDTVESVRALYESVIAENRRIVADLADLDTVDEVGLNARWMLLHVVEELARHAGHADIIRQSIDGTVGT